MKAQFIYSVAALATFPIVVNAQVEAENIGKITAKKDGTVFEKQTEDLVKGNYTFKSTVLSTGTAGKKATVSIFIGDAIEAAASSVFTVGEDIALDFNLTATAKVTIKVQSEEAAADFVVDGSLVQLNFNFSKVAELLQIEYNKVTAVLASAEYPDKNTDATTYSAYYDRILAIANADYAYYTNETEGLKDLADPTVVTGLDLYQKIQTALTDVSSKEKTYQLGLLDGNDGLGGLNLRYANLDESGDVISYITSKLTTLKDAANNARNAYNNDATGANLTAAKKALKAFADELTKEEAVKTTNETAHSNTLAALNAVYGATNSYYTEAKTQINTQYTEPRYSDLKLELTTALEAIVGSTDYTAIKNAIQTAYEAKTSDAKKTEIGIQINAFKQQLTQKISDFNAKRTKLAEVYVIYDAENTDAQELVKDAAGFLVGDPNYKQSVLDAVANFLAFVEGNDQFETVENLTEAAIKEKTDAIANAKKTYGEKAAIYADYLLLKAAVAGETTSLNTVKTDIDADAKDAKKLDDTFFKPTTIWATTISAIETQITTLDGNVDTNETDATAYKDKKAYKDALKAIQDAIAALNTNALAATAQYASISTTIKTANELRAALLDKNVEPMVDLKALNVWSNQVTIDEAVKARTPYKAFIDDTDGSITAAINTLQTSLNAAPSKTEVLNAKKDNVTNILPYLNSLSGAVTAVVNGTALMNDIKANYADDEGKFAQQLEKQECDGLRTNILAKAAAFVAEGSAISSLLERIEAKEFGNVKGALLQEEVNAIILKINNAKAVAEKEDATKAELSAAYNSIKDLATTDIATANANATAYATAFQTFVTNYDNLNGQETDSSDKSTVFGLKKYVAENKSTIDGYTHLSAAQKTTFKNNVDAVKLETVEGEKTVTYTIDNFLGILETAKNNEELTLDEVTKYQAVIVALKIATNGPVDQASKMNLLEGQLKGIDFAAAKAAVLISDPNPNSFYYKQVIGKYTDDFNTLKARIEADTDITSDEYNTTYPTEISDLKALVNGAADLAFANLTNYKAAKKAYDFVPEAGSLDQEGALQRYAKAKATLEKYPSSKLENQLAVIATMKEALDALYIKAGSNYENGIAAAADATAINNQIKAIEEKVAEFINPVNYNAQIAADNLATKNAIETAAQAAADAYQVASVVVNTYKNFQSDELKAASEQANAELQALLTYLAGYDAKVTAIEAAYTKAYSETVAPEVFDAEGTYKAQYETISAEIQNLSKALNDKIAEVAAAKVNTSITTYSNAITASKAKVAKFSTTDKDLTSAVVDAKFASIDNLLNAIVDNKDDETKIKLLDQALVAAVAIPDAIVVLEKTEAVNALKILLNFAYSNELEGSDKTSYINISNRVNSTEEKDKAFCVSNFSDLKASLNELMAKAEQKHKDNQAIADAKGVITDANNAATELSDDYINYGAGNTVKATIEQILADLAAYDKDKVTISNAADWKAAAAAIKGRVTAAWGALFDAEVTVIEGLISKAKEENLTYNGDKAAIATLIEVEEGKLTAAQTAVAKEVGKPGYKTKKDALQGDLKNIEAALNGYIKVLTDANETNLNGVIVDNLNAQVNTQQTALNNSLNVLNGYTVPTALQAAKSDIQTAINQLKQYIIDHADAMASYQTNAEQMLTDIKTAIGQLTADAQAEKVRQDEANAAQALATLNNTWKAAQQLITVASGQISVMKEDLAAYGSTATYANKLTKLDEQVETAEGILTDAKAEADTKEKTADKQTIANNAKNDIAEALTGVAGNCSDIQGLAKTAYINAFIAKLQAQIIADSWTSSANYTNTDKQTLTSLLNALKSSVNTLRYNANSKSRAIDTYSGYTLIKGVITTLNEGETQFNEDLAALKQALKDMSLAEDVKGHVSGNDEITSEDMEDLADIILNAEEGDADLSRCDINGDSQIDVTDLVWLRYFLVHGDWPNVAAGARGDMANDYINMQIVSTENNVTRIAINLDNETVFNHFQLNVQLPEGAKVVGQNLGERVEGANLLMAQNAGTVRLLAISTANNVFAGNSGAVVYIDIENLNGEVSIEKAIFTDTELTGHELTGNSTTGITQTITNALESAGKKIYNLGGKMMNGLKKGINIIRNADGSTTKVMK